MTEGFDGFDFGAWGEWNGEDDDEEFERLLCQTTQVVEQEEERKLLELRTQTRTRGLGMGSGDGPPMSPKVAAHAFDLRRENLPPYEGNAYPNVVVPLSSISQDCSGFPQAAVAKIRYLTQLLSSEKSMSKKQMDELLAEKGQCTNLRRELDTLKQQQLEEQFSRFHKDQSEKQRLEQEKKQLLQKLNSLQTELRIARNEIANAKSKAAMLNVSNRSVGGALSQNQSRDESKLSKTIHHSSPVALKHRSDPYLNTPTQQMSYKNKSQVATTPPAVNLQAGNQTTRLDVEEKCLQINATVQEQEARMKEFFIGERGEEKDVRVTKLEDEEALQRVEEIRIQIHAILQRVINHDYHSHVKDLLRSFAAKAPEEIMARYTKGVEIKTHFPDLIENMFLCGLQDKRKKEKQDKGDYSQNNYPKLPHSKNPEIINLPRLESKLEECFINSAWEALAEVKKQLTNFLSILSGNNRFRLYEYQNLEVLWRLLYWAKHLWRFVIFEEEFDEIVKAYPTWKDELQAWTGLMLKMAWRDFYVLGLEQLVRKFCLNILEIIVITGYFDSSQRRYEILYCILKDTLVKDHLRNEKSLRKSLNIISWSIGDNRNILNYLCMNKKDNNCLARILGEQVVKCFEETDCPTKATTLLLHYLDLLENVMVSPAPEFISKIARGSDQNPSVEINCQTKFANDNSENMDDDPMMCTQFACPDKYKFEEGTRERAKHFNRVEAASCWISPREWEVQIGEDMRTPEDGPCQCRKILLGSAFVMLYKLISWWRQAQVGKEKFTEFMQTWGHVEKCDLEEERTPPWFPEWKEKLAKQLDALTEFILKRNADNFGIIEMSMPSQKESDSEVEILWDTALQNLDIGERLYLENQRIKGTIFDFGVRSGILFLHFCNLHCDNIALAAGSEAFNDFSLMVSAANIRIKNDRWMKETQNRYLMEIIKSGEDDEDEPVLEDSDDSSDCNDENNNVQFVVNDLTEKFVESSIQGSMQLMHQEQIKDEELDAAFREIEKENLEYWDWDEDDNEE